MIRAEHLTKRYRKKVAVNDVSFDVLPGKVTGFLGPNGAGKSTTMRLMVGLDRGEGNTTFEGKRLHEYDRPSQMIGLLLEAKAFHPTRSAADHLRVLAAAGGIADSRVDEVLKQVGLREVADSRPGKFSLGMSQRLGIAAAILGEPKYLLLDEPANGLDPEGIAWLRAFLKDYAARGNAVFISSHLLSEMSQLADNLVVIGRGKLIASTSISELINKSSHSRVFIRTDHHDRLQRLLGHEKLAFDAAGDGFDVRGVTSDDLGRMAFTAGLPVLELTPKQASLEQAFLELTEDVQEYQTTPAAAAETSVTASPHDPSATKETTPPAATDSQPVPGHPTAAKPDHHRKDAA